MNHQRLVMLVVLGALLLLGASGSVGPPTETLDTCSADVVAHHQLPRRADEVLPASLAAVRSLILVDRNTGVTLVERDADSMQIVASTVKMLTALTVFRHAQMDEIVRISSAATATFGATLGLRAGEQYPVAVLLAGMMMRSGNDAALALAQHVAGSEEAFVALMRAEANQLGIQDAIINDPSGLADTNRFSARQLATIADAMLAEPALIATFSQSLFAIGSKRALPNRNRLIGSYPGANGIKTGFTTRAGNALVGSAKRDGRELIAVVLGATSDPQRFKSAEQLLDYGFAQVFAGEVHTQLSWLTSVGMTTWQMPVTTIIADAVPASLVWSLPALAGDTLDVTLSFAQIPQCRWRTMARVQAADRPSSVGDVGRRVVAHGYGAVLFQESSGTLRVPVEGARQ